MRVTRSDEHALVIVDFPYLIGVIGFPMAAYLAVTSITKFAFNGVRDWPAWATLIGTALTFCGSSVFTKRSEFHFDFDAGQLRWRRRGLFTKLAGQVPLDQIHGAFVDENHHSDDGPTFRIALKTETGTIPLTDARSSGEARHQRIRDMINARLQVSLDANTQSETEILNLAIAGKTIEAIKLARRRYGFDLTQAKKFVDGLRS